MRHTIVLAVALLVACGSVSSPSGPCGPDLDQCGEQCVDLMTDPLNCGSCGRVCPAAVHSSRACIDGSCAIECHAGFFDVDGDALTGCEYECTFSAATDTCNGEDDDCDGLADNFAPGSCVQGATVECTTTCLTTGTGPCDDFCNPPAPVECAPPSEICNGEDDDCDTLADDGFDCAAGQDTHCTTTCGSTGSGACLLTCQLPPPGACIPPAEICNGEDDDCVLGADNGFDCTAGQAVACTTPCGSVGTGTCTDGCLVPSAGACTPPAEACNWRDDDCDDDVDEGLWAELISDVQVSDPALLAAYGRVAFGNTNFVVAFSQDPPGDGGMALYAKALDRDGDVVGGGDLLVGPDSTLASDLAWSGSEFLVGFTDSAIGSPDVYGMRIGENGEPPSVARYISGSINSESSVVVTWNGSSWGIGWIDHGTGTRIFLADAAPDTLSTSFEDHVTAGAGYLFGGIDMVWNGSGYGLCWGDDRTGTYQLWFKTVTPLGLDVVADTQVTDTFSEVYSCVLDWTGSEYVVGWSGRDSGAALAGYLGRLDQAGSLVGSTVDLGEIYLYELSAIMGVLATPHGIGVAWVQPGSPADNLMLRRYGFDLVPLESALRVSDGTYRAYSPSLAWDGEAFGVTWVREQAALDGDVMFTRVGCP